MSDYYEWRVNSLQEALEFCETFSLVSRRLVFRGQKDATWELKAGLFRGHAGEKEVDDRFNKTQTFINWCQQNSRLPQYSDEQIYQIAQHYGMFTDLLDFTTSPEVAAFFALGAPRYDVDGYRGRAAIFLADADDLEKLSTIADDPSFASMAQRYVEVLQEYFDVYQDNHIPGLSRLVAQDGVFVRDAGGSFEPLTDGHISYFPLGFEKVVGHSMLLKKVSFTPARGDVELLSSRGFRYDRIFPPPNDLEREIGRFFSLYSEAEYYASRKDEYDRNTLELEGQPLENQIIIEGWDSKSWDRWRSPNLSTNSSARPQCSVLKVWEVPKKEIYGHDPSPCLVKYVEVAKTSGDAFKSSVEICLRSFGGTIHLPVRFQTLLETLQSLPFGEEHLETALRMSIRLFLETQSLPQSALVGGNAMSSKILGVVFGADQRWHQVDVICSHDGYSVKIMLPIETLAALDSVVSAVADFQANRIGQMYGDLSNPGYGFYCMMFHRPAFRSLFEPSTAIDLWTRYAIPWQACFGEWDSAVLNPFMVEFIGLS